MRSLQRIRELPRERKQDDSQRDRTMSFTAGVARTSITPFWGVELTGWGYYIERTWQRVHDDLNATALVLDDGKSQLAILSLDLMVISTEFTNDVRERVQEATGLPPSHVLVACTHTHNAPSTGGLLGGGKVNADYEAWAAKQAATAVILAWRNREPARATTSQGNLPGCTFNRTRENGPVDPKLTTLRVDRTDGSPLAMVVNFQAHPTVHTKLRPFDVTRDVPGEVCDIIEAALPGATALYLQGACGDVNFLRDFSTPERCHEPARLVAGAALASQASAVPLIEPKFAASSEMVRIPTRRWTREEMDGDRDEAQQRLQNEDMAGWKKSIGRVMTNNPADMVARHGGDEWKAVQAMCRFNLAWTYDMRVDWETRPEYLETEIQAVRVGKLAIVTNATEFFSSLSLDVRNRARMDRLMISGYTNGRIGYMPDAHDVTAKSYAAYQSPKYCNQFPFTVESGPAMCDAMVRLVEKTRQIP
jgi:hypothetical protein